MSKSTRVPTYRLHRQSNQAVVTLPDGRGRRRDVLLGTFGSSESRAEYARVVAEWEANGRRLPGPAAVADLSVNELVVAFWHHAEQHYRRPDGTPTNELHDFRLSIRPLVHLYGFTRARDFGPLGLKAVRRLMVEGYEHPEYGPQAALARGVVNQRVGRIRRLFRWAVENELVPPSVVHGLEAVRGLQRGRSAAHETEPVKPVPEPFVEATLPQLLPQVAAMVWLQRLTGMRPGEVCVMRGIDLEMTGQVWLFRPGSDQGPHGAHKTAWRGQHRVVPIGPQAQALLRPWLRLNLHEYLFQPREAVAALHAERKQQRKSPVQPSQAKRRRKPRPQRAPGEQYTVASYGKAVAKACMRALPPGWHPPLALGIPEWHPNQLRHLKATELRKEFGIDAARVVLGHRSPQVTETYAELDLRKAVEAAELAG
jgi:integrase